MKGDLIIDKWLHLSMILTKKRLSIFLDGKLVKKINLEPKGKKK